MGGTKQKVGKARRDKYYHLAKESGYRARSAFKLIQLNRKFEFLQKARCCIDLCAAPGGWMQVAAEFMPVSSLIVGVDLVPIKPIRGAISFCADITTDKCRQRLKQELKHFKADVVLHDGAPNVGAAWVQDAYSQSHLVLMSLKLATEFMRAGGTFVTKVFRSRDYQSLIFVFKQLFRKVRATKPQSSRNVSAEIFVVCQGYLAPAKTDPRIFDPTYVFQELEDPVAKIDVLQPEKQKKRKALGYADGESMFFTAVSVMDFVTSVDYMDILASCAQLHFDACDPAVLKSRLTTEEIKSCCEDLKVLGKADFKVLIKWRLQMRELLAANKKKAKAQDAAENGAGPADDLSEIEEEDEDGEMDEGEADPDLEVQKELDAAIEKLKQSKEAEKRRLKRLQHRNEMKRRKRLALAAADDISDITRDQSLFDLKVVKSKKELDTLDDEEWEALAVDSMIQSTLPGITAVAAGADDHNADSEREFNSSDEEDYMDVLESQLEKQYEEFQMRKGQKSKRVRLAHNKSKRLAIDEEGAMHMANVKRKEGADGSGDEDEDGPLPTAEEAAQSNPLMQDSAAETRRSALWFSQEQFEGLSDSDAEEEEGGEEEEAAAKSGELEAPDGETANADDQADSEDEAGAAGGFEEVPVDAPSQGATGDNLDAQGLLIARQLLTATGRRKLLDQSYNRYSHNDDPLPMWFEDEEWVHKQASIPMTREMADEIKAMQREIDARPIKKVREAKAKKKMRSFRKMEKVKTQALAISENALMTEQEKARNIQQLYKKAARKPQVERTYVVAKRGLAKKRYKRPNGVTGVFKVVDPRMKKDLRAQKNKEKTKRGKKAKRR